MPKKVTRELLTEADTDAFRLAVSWATKVGLPVRRVSDHQIKIAHFNLWPNTGSWNDDLSPRKQPGGFRTFQQAVLQWWQKEDTSSVISLEE